jgi:hypothetical protein
MSVLTITAVSGCYSYTRVSPEAVTPGTGVRGHLSPVGASIVEEITGRATRTVDGSFVRSDADSIVFSVPIPRSSMELRSEALHQFIGIPKDQVVDLELRRLDRTRTYGLAAALGAVAAYVLIETLSGDSGSSGQGPGGPGTPENRIPLVRVP